MQPALPHGGYAPGTIPASTRAVWASPRGGAAQFRARRRHADRFNNASMFAIDQFHLPVTNLLGALTPSILLFGSLLRWNCATPRTRGAGIAREPIVMFERGPPSKRKPVRERSGRLPADRNPWRAVLLAPERIQGKPRRSKSSTARPRLPVRFPPAVARQSHGRTNSSQRNLRFRRRQADGAAASRRAPANSQQESCARRLPKCARPCRDSLAEPRVLWRKASAVDERAKLKRASISSSATAYRKCRTPPRLDDAGAAKRVKWCEPCAGRATSARKKRTQPGCRRVGRKIRDRVGQPGGLSPGQVFRTVHARVRAPRDRPGGLSYTACAFATCRA